MKVTFVRTDGNTGRESISTCEAGAFMERIKTETRERDVSGLRTMISYAGGPDRGSYSHIDRLPRVFPAVEMGRTREGERRVKQYNGIVMLDVQQLSGPHEVEMVKEQAALLPQTCAAFAGSSGRSVKIWVRFALPDGNLPQREEEINLFHAHAYRMAVHCYQPILPFPILLKEPSPADSCRMTLDPRPFFNPDAVPFCLEQPLAMPGEPTFRERRMAEENPLQRLQPGCETSQTFTMLFETALRRAFEEVEDWRRDDELHPLLIHIGEHCFRAGIPEEEAVRQVMMHFYRQADELTVRTTFHNLYSECRGFGKRSVLTPEQDTCLKLEEFMERRYEVRYNQLTADLEYRRRDSIHFYFHTMDQRARSSVAMDALQEGIRVWDRDVNRYLTSPLLIGGQGFRKSTFCRIILPPELRFGYTDSLDFKSKRDAEMYLGRFLLINIDEFDQISANQQGFLKHLLQKPVANLRKPYGSSIQEMRRYASFIGTSNHKDLLTDTSGSRRFVCVEVTAPIRTDVTINYKQLYAQAMHDLLKGERYWFDDNDETLLRESNREFEQISPLEQQFHCCFRSPEEGEAGEYLSPMQMLEALHARNREIKLNNSNVCGFGRILKKNNLKCKRTNKGVLYWVARV